MINDLFIFDESGIPHMARCFGGKLCKLDAQHTLLTGFLAAVNSFKGEFDQTELRTVAFDKAKLIFSTENSTLAALYVESEDDTEEMRKLCSTILTKFNKDHNIPEDGVILGVDPSEEFVDWVDNYLHLQAMGSIKKLLKEKKNSLWQSFKNAIW